MTIIPDLAHIATDDLPVLADTLFVSALQQSHHPTREQIRAEVTKRLECDPQCVICVAEETVAYAYGKHPDEARERMLWSLQMVGLAYRPCPQPLRRFTRPTEMVTTSEARRLDCGCQVTAGTQAWWTIGGSTVCPITALALGADPATGGPAAADGGCTCDPEDRSRVAEPNRDPYCDRCGGSLPAETAQDTSPTGAS